MRCIKAASIFLLSATASGCFTLQNHYSVVDSSGFGASPADAGGALSIWMLVAGAVAGLVLGAGLVWVVLKWRGHRPVIAVPEAVLASDLSHTRDNNMAQPSARTFVNLRPT
jgi:hypothetical protein